MDHYFLEREQTVNRLNWFEYIQLHPEYEGNCLNRKYADNPEVNLQMMLSKNENGIFYEYEVQKDSQAGIIKKILIDQKKTYLLKIYYLFDNKIIEALDLRTILLQKVGNLSCLLGQIVSQSMKDWLIYFAFIESLGGLNHYNGLKGTNPNSPPLFPSLKLLYEMGYCILGVDFGFPI